jgi:uncharacterized protein (DUF302 family)
VVIKYRVGCKGDKMTYEQAMLIIMQDVEEHFKTTTEDYKVEHNFQHHGFKMFIKITHAEYAKKEKENATIH